MPNRRRLLIGALGLAWSARSGAIIGGTEDGSPPDSPASRIDPNAANSPWAGIGSLSVKSGREHEHHGIYTASAIDARHVITAAHVVSGRDAADVRFNLNYGADLSHRLEAEAIAIHPDYAGFRPDPGSGVVHDDVAIVRLRSPLPFGVPFYAIRRSPIVHHAVVTLVGYGASGDGAGGHRVAPSAAVKRVGRNVIDAAFRDNGGSDVLEVYLFDFDGPDASSNRLGGGSLGNDIEATVSGGDSGSPALVPGARGSWQLVGINTFVAPRSERNRRFGGLGGGVLLYPYVDWVDKVKSEGGIPRA
jgi:hypothetical protein